MLSRKELFFKLNVDYDDIKIVKQLAKDFQEWCRWNKSYEIIEVIESKEFETIVVIHQLFDDYIKVTDSWEFIRDVKYFLKAYSDQSKEDCIYMITFWEEKVQRLNEIK